MAVILSTYLLFPSYIRLFLPLHPCLQTSLLTLHIELFWFCASFSLYVSQGLGWQTAVIATVDQDWLLFSIVDRKYCGSIYGWNLFQIYPFMSMHVEHFKRIHLLKSL